MPRHFVAIPLPDEAKERLVGVQPFALPGMRLLGQQEMHLTLHFLGEVAVQDDEVVRKALASVKIDGFTITMKGVGQFPPEGQPQVLWAGVESNPCLFALHQSIGTALTDAIGFQPESRPDSPHVTLARLNSPVPPGVVERFLEDHRNFTVPRILIKEFALYSSVLIENIPRYQLEALLRLSEPASSA